MDVHDPVHPGLDPPSAKAVRRFWFAWLIFLLVMLMGLAVVILVAAVMADPPPISPAG